MVEWLVVTTEWLVHKKFEVAIVSLTLMGLSDVQRYLYLFESVFQMRSTSVQMIPNALQMRPNAFHMHSKCVRNRSVSLPNASQMGTRLEAEGCIWKCICDPKTTIVVRMGILSAIEGSEWRHGPLPIKICVSWHGRESFRNQIVTEYKHIGYYTNSQHAKNNCIIYRIGKAKESMATMAERVLGNPKLSLAVRERFALIFIAKMLANDRVWHNSSEKTLIALDTPYNNIHQYVTCQNHKVNASDTINTQALYEMHPFKNVMA